jgi:phosphopantetheinyl transferase
MASSVPIWVALLTGGAPPDWPLHPREVLALSPRAVPKRRDDFLRGRAVGRALARQVLGLDPASIAILPDDRGVPWLEHDHQGRLPFSLSLSHTAEVAGAALAGLPWLVGIDVEHPIESPGTVMGDYFEPEEAARCDHADEAEVRWRAAEVWALKEAGLKALGTGLTVPASAIVVRAVQGEASPEGWHDVTLVLGDAAPDRYRTARAWVRRTSQVVVALAVVSDPQDGRAVVPEAPRSL